MLVSYLWLKELVHIDASPEDVAAKLTTLGLEASIVDDRRGRYEGVVIGKVLSVTKHTNADKLNLTEVDIGDDTPLKIVCGAANVATGQLVAVATVGTILPGDFKIAERKVRGELSLGMICSESELELSDESDGIMVLDDNPVPGDKFADRYEVCDTIIEVDLTPNRGDCASMIGVARDLAAAYGIAPLKLPETVMDESGEPVESMVAVTISAPDLCPRYTARIISGASVRPSPFWLRRRLAAVGLRTINNIVDITNYVLMETGHPLHAFDFARLKGSKIDVRRAKKSEIFTTLDGTEHKLTDDNLVIADGERAVALAGVMGGQNSEVSAETRDILLESAFFVPAGIRRTARALNISSESSYRFERGTDVEGLLYAQDRAASLMATLCDGTVALGRVDVYPNKIVNQPITLRYQRMRDIIGVEVTNATASEILARLDMPPVTTTDDSITVISPTYRFDLEREIDLIEEVARHIGYDQIASLIPRVASAAAEPLPILALRTRFRNGLRAAGMTEGLRYSFTCEKDLDRLLLGPEHPFRQVVAIDNPISTDTTHLRSSLIPGLLGPMRSATDALIFEIGVVFESTGKTSPPNEQWMTAGAITETISTNLYTGRAGKRDFFHAKGIVEKILAAAGFVGRFTFVPSSEPFFYPKRQTTIMVDKTAVGILGQIHPGTLEAYEIDQELFVFEINLTALSALLRVTPKYRPISKFPFIKRDLAVVAPDHVTTESLTKTILASGAPHISEAILFDLFRSPKLGSDKKSVAFSLTFANETRTLTDDEADEAFANIVTNLQSEQDAHLRT